MRPPRDILESLPVKTSMLTMHCGESAVMMGMAELHAFVRPLLLSVALCRERRTLRNADQRAMWLVQVWKKTKTKKTPLQALDRPK